MRYLDIVLTYYEENPRRVNLMSEETTISRSLPEVLLKVLESRPSYRIAVKLCCDIRVVSTVWNKMIEGWCVWHLHDEGKWRGDQPIYRAAMLICPQACLIHLIGCPNCEIKGKQGIPYLLSSRRLPQPSLMLSTKFFAGTDASMDRKYRANSITGMLLAVNGASEHLLPQERTQLLNSLITTAASLELPKRAQSDAKKYQHLFTPLPNEVREHYLARHGYKKLLNSKKELDDSFHPTLVAHVRQHVQRRIQQFFLLCTAVYKDQHTYQVVKATFQPGKGEQGFQAAHDSPVSALNRIDEKGIFESCALGQGIAALKIFREINRTMELPTPANSLDTYVEEHAGLRDVACELLNQVANGKHLPPYDACQEFVNHCMGAIENAKDHYGNKKDDKATNELIIRFANIELETLEKYDGISENGDHLKPLLNGLVRQWLGENFDVSNAHGLLQGKLIKPL
jgi:hypothetical protein